MTGFEVEESSNIVERVPATLTSIDPMIAMIERVVCDPAASTEKLEKMLELRERMEDRARQEDEREYKRKYNHAMAECQKELVVISKMTTNKYIGTTYADLAAIARDADPIIHKHGFSISFQPDGTNDKGELVLRWTIAHSGGHMETGTAAFPMDASGTQGKTNKTPIQALGSTITYGRRYLKLMLFDIATGEDNDGNAIQERPTITDAQKKRLQELITETDANEAEMLAHFRIDRLEDLPVACMQSALNIFYAKKKRMAQSQPKQSHADHQL